VGFLVLSAWCLGVLNSHRRFFLSYVAPVVWNITQITVLIAAALVLFDGDLSTSAVGAATDGELAQLAVALAWGVLAGGILQFLVQVPAVLRSATGLRLSLDTRLAGVRTALSSFWPVVAGRGVVQLMTYVDIALASLLATGAVSALEYATRLALLPISLFGMSVAASELPELSSLDADESHRVADRLAPMLARIAFYVVPTIAAFVVVGDLLYDLVLPTLEARVVWLVLLGSTVGLLSNTSSRLLQSALYGGGDTRTPTRYAIIRVVVAAVVGAVLMLQFDRLALTGDGIVVEGTLPAFAPLPPAVRQTESLRLGAVGLALAAGASSWLEFTLLRRFLAGRRGVEVHIGGGLLGRTATAGMIAGALGLATRVLLAGNPSSAVLLAAGGVIGITYLLLAAALRLPEIRQLRRLLS
jgi:putative peptidoglycan lipid II flippase